MHRDNWVTDATNPWYNSFTLTFRHQCYDFEITNDSTYIGRQNPIIIDHGSDVAIALSFVQNPTSNGCTKIYNLEFYNDNTRIWETYNIGSPATSHSFVKVGSFATTAGGFTIDASYDSHRWSAPPQYTVIAKISVTAP